MSENFDVDNNNIKKALDSIERQNNKGELDMSVSAICQNENGDKYAYVHFSDGIREAEGIIPKCKIEKNQGFAEIEVQELEKYMQDNLQQLKKTAAGIDIFSAFLRD